MALCLTRARLGMATWGALAALAGSAWGQCPAGWTHVNVLGPINRVNHGQAFDPARARTVVFGGFDTHNFVILGDTWVYTASGWTEVFPASSPGVRQSLAMAYDSARQRVVLFAGRSGVLHNDTWEWNGTNWTRVHDGTGTAPGTRELPGMAYDASRSVMVMFGGRDAGLAAKGDTWEFNGATAVWTERLPAVAPAARDAHTMAYDTSRQRVVLYGGQTDTVGIVGDTWEWTGTNWSPSPGEGPEARIGSAMAYDAARQRMVLFGGAGAVFHTDTWERAGTAWEQVATTMNPPGRSFHAMSYDSGRGRVVLFGGANANGALRDVWEYVCGGTCYANCDGSTVAPILNVNDFICFSQRFAATDPYANCDGSTIAPVLNVGDFVCFQQRFAAGCR